MMKKGGLNFLSRRNQSLFDTKVPMKDLDSVEFVYDAVVIPESGTAKVRSRPTIKHFSTFGDGAGFAVPTPTVPDLPSFTPQISHTGNTVSLSNGSAISVDDTEDRQILIPPPPSTAPPPPPPQFIPPPPGHDTPPSAFFDEPYSPVDLSTLEPPPMPPPKPPSQGMSENVDLSMLKPPPMAPPKPPQISSSSPEDIPECPKFTPPLPPTETPQSPISKVQKMPPPKPIRFSSISNLELPSSGPSTPTYTTLEKPAANFNSLNTGQLYTVPKTTSLNSLLDRENMTQHILPAESSRNSPGAYINGKAPASEKEMSTPQNLTPPVKPVRRNSSGIKLEENLQELKVNKQMTLPATPVRVIKSVAATVETPSDVQNTILTPIKDSPTAERQASVLSAQDIINLTPVDPMRKYSPFLNRKLQNLKTNEPPGGKEVVASPFALLMAAKEREKQKAAISRENSSKSNSSLESTNESIHPSNNKPNLFTITPNPPDMSRSVSPFMKANSNTENPKGTYSILEPSIPSGNIQHKNSTSILSPPSTSGQFNGFDVISFIPPPPEFANSDTEEVPPSMPPPDPPTKTTGVLPLLNSAPITNIPTNPPSIKTPSMTTQFNAVSNTQFKPKPQVPLSSQPKFQPQAAPPPVQLKTQPQDLPPPQPKFQPQALTPPQHKFQSQTPPQPKFQSQTPPQPKFQSQTPPQPKFQSQTPPQPKFQSQTPPQPKFQPQAQPTPQPKFQPQTPPPPQPKFQPQTPPPPQPKFQLQTPPPPQPKFQPQIPPPPQPKFQPQIPLPSQQKIQPQTAHPSQSKFQPQTPPPSQPKTQPQTPPSVAANQATLLSILQKKMLEMDPKFAPAHEADPYSDEWNSPQFDEDVGVGPSINSIPKPQSSSLPTQPAGLNIKELENKVTKKSQAKAPASSGSSKQQFGMTFIVRPGTKQPITPIPKTE